jgi:phospholipid transport system substrate-binding protein
VPLREQRSSSLRVPSLEGAVKPAAGSAFVLFVRGSILTLTVIAGVLAPQRSAAADDAPIAFIRALGNQAVSVLRSDMPPAEKAAYFRQMIHRDFDLTGICRFVLGPYWRIASPAELHKFRNLFADRLVRFYGRRLAQSSEGDFVVTDSRTGPDGIIVISQIMPRQGVSIAIGWRLGLSDGVYKIQDVAIDGVSMALASAPRSRRS